MKWLYTLCIVSILFSSCSRSIFGHYRSSCIYQGEYFAHIILLENNQFELKQALWHYWDMSVKGEWKISGDTLILSSSEFDYYPLNPEPQIAKQLTSFQINTDYFIIKGRKLYGLSESGSFEPCYMTKLRGIRAYRRTLRQQ